MAVVGTPMTEGEDPRSLGQPADPDYDIDGVPDPHVGYALTPLILGITLLLSLTMWRSGWLIGAALICFAFSGYYFWKRGYDHS